MRKAVVFLSILLFSVSGIFAAEGEVSASPSEKNNEKLLNDMRNAVNFVKDFLDDKKPVRIDFGAEPHRHGSTIFGLVQYDFIPKIGSSLRLEYDNYSTSESEFSTGSNSIATSSTKSFYVAPFPFIWYIGDSSAAARTPALRLGVGAFYQYGVNHSYTGLFSSQEEPAIDDVLFYSLDIETQYHRIGPALQYSFNLPFLKYFSLVYEGQVVPVYYSPVTVSSTVTERYLSESKDYSETLFSASWSSPILSQMIAVDVVRYFRFACEVNHESLKLKYILKNGEGTEDSLDNISHTVDLRFGTEILKPAKSRKKASHLRAGIYYNMRWSFYENDGQFSNATRKDDIVLCFGT